MSKNQKTQDKAGTQDTKLVIPKKPKTVMENGLTYSLISRVRNAFPTTVVRELEKDSKGVPMVDGRGADQEVYEPFISMASQLGAKFLAGTRSSFLRPRIKWDGKKVTLVEIEKKEPAKKAPAETAEAATAKSA